MDTAVVGRDAVLEQARQALRAAGAVLLDGPAGIGKTAVWRALVAEAGHDGWVVLTCAPSEMETGLPFAALADLLRPLADRAAELPQPQRNAVEAVLLAATTDEPVEERVIGAATRTLLEQAIAGAPRVLLAVDDVQWLDRPSERALHFALRRLTQPTALLVAQRPGAAPSAPPLVLDQEPLRGRLTEIALEPLGVGALHHILRARLSATLQRPLLARIATQAQGNPLLAIELTRAVLRLPRLPAPGEDLPVAASMQRLLDETLAVLPVACREAVRLAALLADPTLRDLTAAGVRPEAFDAAEEAGVLAVTTRRVEFTHPVYPAAVRAGLPPGVRRRLHRRLADVVVDPDERARQLAAGATEPDADVARELSEAAARCRARGAPDVAAELHERAAALTPPTEAVERGRRALAAAWCRFDSGDYPHAAVAADAVAAEASGDLCAEALLLRAAVAFGADEVATAVSAAERALAEASPGTVLAGRIHAHLSVFHDAPGPAWTHAQAAMELLSASATDRRLLAGTLMMLFFNEVRVGQPARTELLERGLELEGDEPSWLAGTVPPIWWKAVDDHDRARTRLHRMLDWAVVRGDEPSQHEVLTHLGEAELLAGRWTAATDHVAAARVLGEQLGTGLVGETWLAGMLLAHQGQLVEAARIAESGLRRAAEQSDPWCRRINLQLTAFVALADGRMADAAAAYGELAAAVDASGLVEPLTLRFEPDWIEACVGSGDLDLARTVLDRLAARHARLARPWTTLGLARARALLDGAAGNDPAKALADLAAARASVPADVLPLDRARCLLVAGVVARRARRRREAGEALRAAAEEFAVLGAAAFERRARAELDRIGGRSSAPLELSATEERVARLAASGKTNRMIAEQLFLSPKTVEANLARVYRKLGISSRAELGARMATLPSPPSVDRETPDS